MLCKKKKKNVPQNGALLCFTLLGHYGSYSLARSQRTAVGMLQHCLCAAAEISDLEHQISTSYHNWLLALPQVPEWFTCFTWEGVCLLTGFWSTSPMHYWLHTVSYAVLWIFDSSLFPRWFPFPSHSAALYPARLGIALLWAESGQQKHQSGKADLLNQVPAWVNTLSSSSMNLDYEPCVFQKEMLGRPPSYLGLWVRMLLFLEAAFWVLCIPFMSSAPLSLCLEWDL